MKDDFDCYAIPIDSECLNQDFKVWKQLKFVMRKISSCFEYWE